MTALPMAYTVSIMLGKQFAGYVEHGLPPGRRTGSGAT
jgi:hypothetical protein